MTWNEFIAGKYGISHGVITAGVILIGTVLFGAVGNLAAAWLALAAYFVREAQQGHSLDPRRWSLDGKYDLLVPALVVAVNVLGVLAWH